MKKPKKLRSRKAGLPPGSLVHIGEVKVTPPSVSLIDFGTAGLIERQLPEVGSLASYQRTNDILWGNIYGLHDPTPLAALGNAFSLHPLVLEDILNTDQRQKVESYDDYLYVVLHRYEITTDPLTLAQDQISLIIGPDYLLSFQERQSRTFEPVRQRLRMEGSKLRAAGMDMLAYSLLDSVVDSYFGVIEKLDDYAEKLEAEILGQPGPGILENIHQFRRCVSLLRRNLYPLREVIGDLQREHTHFLSPDIQLYLRDTYDHTINIIESLEDLRELATGLLDIHLTTSSHRVNLEVRALTVVATIFMPVTLIAGIFGMNFREMPWLAQPFGFYYATGLMLAIASIMLILFLRRR